MHLCNAKLIARLDVRSGALREVPRQQAGRRLVLRRASSLLAHRNPTTPRESAPGEQPRPWQRQTSEEQAPAGTQQEKAHLLLQHPC